MLAVAWSPVRGFEDSDHYMGWSDNGRDDTDEEEIQDSDTSVQSMVTHIRTPPHTFEFEDVPLVLGGGNAPAVEDSPSSHDTFHSARSHHATPGSLPFSTSQRDGGDHRQPRPGTVELC